MEQVNHILQRLIDDGRLAREQTVQSCLPAIYPWGMQVVTGIDHAVHIIGHFLNQTSGVADYYEGGDTPKRPFRFMLELLDAIRTHDGRS